MIFPAWGKEFSGAGSLRHFQAHRAKVVHGEPHIVQRAGGVPMTQHVADSLQGHLLAEQFDG
jgi:hypothetical protein